MAGFSNQAKALFRKNLAYHKHHLASNVRIILFPVIVFGLVALLKLGMSKSAPKIPMSTFNTRGEINPPLLQVPPPEFRAVKSQSVVPFTDLPDESCRKGGSCPATILVTGTNRTLALDVITNTMLVQSLSKNFPKSFPNKGALRIIGTDEKTISYFTSNGSALSSLSLLYRNLYRIQPHCLDSSTKPKRVECVEAFTLWRNNYSEIDDELFKGYYKGNNKGEINEILGVYDFQNTSTKNLNVNVGYNATYGSENRVVRVQKAENMITNGFLQYLLGPSARIILESVAEMPRQISLKPNDLNVVDSALNIILVPIYIWTLFQLFPVMLQTLVYERQQKLRMMMGMHGLGHKAYWIINYMYFLVISTIYIVLFLIAGKVTGLRIFKWNSISVQFVFYFVYINTQISLSFFLSLAFKSVKTASVVGFLMLFTGGIIGSILSLLLVYGGIESRLLVIGLQLYPVFALNRGLGELSEYAMGAETVGTFGFEWRNWTDGKNGMLEALLVMVATWFLFLMIGYSIDKFSTSGRGIFSIFEKSRRRNMSSSHGRQDISQESHIVQMEREDIAHEDEKVQELRTQPNSSYSTICCDLKKIYPGRDGNPDKLAVRGVNLALPRGECFGILGPNGAGKTTFISMMTGLLEPTSGTAFVEKLDLRSQMNMIHNIMGVCPQFDVLWDILTAREHLNFYGMLKNLNGHYLRTAVDHCLKGVDLLQVADKQAGQFSGGMKRRLSVAISLIGNPKIVYLDEPSTGLDPASRKKLWEVLRREKKDKTIILTTHSMEEAERLCDRIGIFADGKFLCLGSTDELKNRYGGHYVLTIATHPQNVEDVKDILEHLTTRGRRTYHLSGTQKFEIPKDEVRKSDIFQFVRRCRDKFPIETWGVSETTLEEVFIKVVSEENH